MGIVRSMRDGIAALWNKKSRNHAIDEELQSFIEESAKDKMRRGMSYEQAMRSARAEAGSADSVKHSVWLAGWESKAEMLWSDIVYTFRRLSKSPGLVCVVALSIGLGIASNATIFSLVSRFILRPAPVGQPSTLVEIYRTFEHGQCCNNLPAPVVYDLQQQAKSFSGITAYEETLPVSIANGSTSARFWGQATSWNYFNVLQLNLVAGRGFLSSEKNSPVIVLGYRLWQQHFGGDRSVVGRAVNVSGYLFTVVGIAPPAFHGVDQILDSQFWVPLGNLPQLTPHYPGEISRAEQWLRLAGRLRPGVTRQQAAGELDVIAQRLAQAHPETDKDDGFHLETAGSLPGRDKQMIEMFLAGLSAIALITLCIACANVANLLLVASAERQREMAVRLALGATRCQLLRQVLIESILLSLSGGVLGVLLSVAATYALSSFRLPVPVEMDLTVHVDWRVVAYAFGLSVAAGLLCGIVPAWAASHPRVSSALKGEKALVRSGRRWSLRSTLVVTQITLSLVLLCAAGLFLRSLHSASQIDAGFRTRGLVMMSIDPQLHRYTPERSVRLLQSIRERVAATPGVLSATTTDGVPLSMGHRSDGFEVPGRPKPQGENIVDLYMAGPGYFDTFGIPRVLGQEFSEENPSATKVALVNEEFVKHFFDGANPIGHTVNGAGVLYQIVGVVKNTKSRTIGEDTRPILYRSIDQNIASDPSATGYSIVARYEGEPIALTHSIEQQIHSIDPALAIFNTQTMQEHIHEALFLPRFVGTLFTVFAGVGLLLATIGLYSVMSYSVSQRTKEIGIRMALGARALSVQRMVVGGGMRLAILSVVLGIPAALAASRLTTSLLYGIHPWDVATFTTVPLLLILVCLAACWLPSRRASRVEPMTALRSE